jgi:hypothetical protein
MNRTRAFGLATAVSATAAGAIFAVGANFGLFGAPRLATARAMPVVASAVDPNGSTTTVAPPPRQVVEDIEYVDVPVQVPVPASATVAGDGEDAPPVAATGSTPAPLAEHRDADGPTEATTSTSATAGHDYQPCEVHDDGRVECHDHADD